MPAYVNQLFSIYQHSPFAINAHVQAVQMQRDQAFHVLSVQVVPLVAQKNDAVEAFDLMWNAWVYQSMPTHNLA